MAGTIRKILDSLAISMCQQTPRDNGESRYQTPIRGATSLHTNPVDVHSPFRLRLVHDSDFKNQPCLPATPIHRGRPIASAIPAFRLIVRGVTDFA